MRPHSSNFTENAWKCSPVIVNPDRWKCDPIQRHIFTSLLLGSAPPPPLGRGVDSNGRVSLKLMVSHMKCDRWCRHKFFEWCWRLFYVTSESILSARCFEMIIGLNILLAYTCTDCTVLRMVRVRHFNWQFGAANSLIPAWEALLLGEMELHSKTASNGPSTEMTVLFKYTPDFDLNTGSTKQTTILNCLRSGSFLDL